MAIDFPNSPAINDTFTANGSTWKWDGISWNVLRQPVGTLGVVSPITKTGTYPDATIGIDQSLLVIAESQVIGLVTDLAGKTTEAFVNTSISNNNKITYAASDATTAYTLVSSDVFKLKEFTNSAAITVTVPNDPTDSLFPLGSTVELRQMGTGRITIAVTSPATLVSTDSYVKTRTQYSSVILEKRASNTWILTGDIDA